LFGETSSKNLRIYPQPFPIVSDADGKLNYLGSAEIPYIRMGRSLGTGRGRIVEEDTRPGKFRSDRQSRYLSSNDSAR